MRFLWPGVLWGALGLPLLLTAYVRALHRPRHPVRFPPATTAALAARAAGWRRHLPPALFGAALVMALVAAARPVAPWPVASTRPVVLVIDVSRSMEETDIPPTRLEAAKAAAAEFVRRLPPSTPVALVTFGNYATLVVPPTRDRPRLLAALAALTTQLRTQLGNGLLEGVRAVADAPRDADPRAVVVLLSDGRASDGVPPLVAAQQARAARVRVYTIGMGTGGDPSRFRSGYWGVLDEETLRAVAELTGGRYWHAASARDLRAIYRSLAGTLGWTRQEQEVSAVAALAAAAVLVLALLARGRLAPAT
ncbi:MAG: VWA domain-containing protein [Armatimonadota bacterium]|nr:VWA domain-containing protein [Armatimonadota bacterium]MDR7448446.1 VWA domain-containing protein [Armatimonadota bacterium]MDR7459544.1 VWA domain-containing protein [Armatimonadota bacterium]MDR7480368.1 VWA domain-containing protein [Armatimonadota bacterium]MDR7488285.1 VWA domain-containing protein [Armatimonadota bacterium]